MEKNDFFDLMETVGIGQDLLLDLAYQTGLIKRKRLLLPSDILYALCVGSTNGTVSCNDIAAMIDSNCGVSVSRQAVGKKIDKQCEDFFKGVFEHIILRKIDIKQVEIDKCSKYFNRVIVQDSTIIRLPARLFEIFSGVANAHSKVCNARIQSAYDIVSEQFILFSINPYSKNDLASAHELDLQKGDLILRDRGYLIADEIQRHIDNKADCIFRYKHRTGFMDVETQGTIDILEKLENENSLDMKVMLNNGSRTIVRLVAAPINEETANIRRMRAKKESKNIPSIEYLKLLSWSIYITTINKELMDFPTIYQVYKLRWRIEIIFKCWKSNMGFANIHNVSKSQLYILLYARFIMIIIAFQHIFKPCRKIIKKLLNKNISLFKVTQYLTKNPNRINKILKEICQYSTKLTPSIAALAKYCSYDKRKRLNFQQEIDLIFY